MECGCDGLHRHQAIRGRSLPRDTQMMVVRGRLWSSRPRWVTHRQAGFQRPRDRQAWNARSCTAVMPREMGAGADGLVRRGRWDGGMPVSVVSGK